jgi:pimeloyl-ACP methyl ester carboxylesterase
MSVELQTVPFRGSTLSCRVVGNAGAPWLVVTHGMALDCSSFEGLAERFASRWRVLLWDMPGHGKSGPMPRPFDMQVCVDALETVLDAHDVDKAVLLGFSFGGVVSQLLAHRAPQRVLGVLRADGWRRHRGRGRGNGAQAAGAGWRIGQSAPKPHSPG